MVPSQRSASSVAICGLLLLTIAQHGLAALDPSRAPAANFNLTNFYLGLPVDSSGGVTGDSASITAAQLTAGYSNALYFYTGPDGAMTFWAPVTGATTSGSSYPRSELREQISPPSNSSNWFGFGTHTLDAQCRVTQVPSTAKVIIGQIHGYTGAALPLVKLQYSSGTIEALIKTNANDTLTDKKYIYSFVGLSNSITYQIKMVNGLISITINGSTQSLNVFQTDPDWATNTLYFKAGSYCQDNAGATNEGGRVAFYSLTRSHAPAITNQPISHSAVAGTNTTFNVSATGNGLLRYQWRFNSTNNLTGATNATLALTNLQPINAGDYSVRVTDNLGAITSAVATLSVIVPPAITVQPTNQWVIAGGTASFHVAATGSAPLSFQWYYNTNTPLPGQTNSLLQLTNTGLAEAGYYSVRITNAAGAASSGQAALVVDVPIRPVTQAISNEGLFSAWFEGASGLSYIIDRATNVAGPWESGFTNLTADANGLFGFTDSTTAQLQRFYRARRP